MDLPLISLLTPTRARPAFLERMWQSACATAADELELVVYCDTDDESPWPHLNGRVKRVRGPRIVLSEMWNHCWREANGDVFMHCADDIIFRTTGWDALVYDALRQFDDRIMFIHGDDGHWGERFGTHGFVSREWTDVVGTFVPPYFSSDYNDTWLNEVANLIGRRRYVPIVTEHMHFAFGKGPLDRTHEERLARHREDNVDERYGQLVSERQAWADRLRHAIMIRAVSDV